MNRIKERGLLILDKCEDIRCAGLPRAAEDALRTIIIQARELVALFDGPCCNADTVANGYRDDMYELMHGVADLLLRLGDYATRGELRQAAMGSALLSARIDNYLRVCSEVILREERKCAIG